MNVVHSGYYRIALWIWSAAPATPLLIAN